MYENKTFVQCVANNVPGIISNAPNTTIQSIRSNVLVTKLHAAVKIRIFKRDYCARVRYLFVNNIYIEHRRLIFE